MNLLPEDFEDKLKTKVIGHPLYIYSELNSTQTTAKHLAESGIEEGATVLAYSQRKGTGKDGKNWFSPKGGIWFTIILRPTFYAEKANLINIVLATACSEVLSSFKNIAPVIKWPNDILTNGKKICGILSQIKSKKDNNIDYALVGIGVNVNITKEFFPDELKDSATSLKIETKKDIEPHILLAYLLEKIEEYYFMLEDEDFNLVRERWGNFSIPFGSLIKTTNRKQKFQGQLIGVNEFGHLIIRTSHGSLKELVGGEIELIG